jgi:LysR family transcriptional regulator, hydrogen peroxide-inducible genes activator
LRNVRPVQSVVLDAHWVKRRHRARPYQSERDDWILAMIAGGMSYGFMPRSSALYPGVIYRPLTEPEFWRTVNLVAVRGRRHSPAMGALVREVVRTKWQGRQSLAADVARAGIDEEPSQEAS